MADVPGKFYRATKVRTGVAPSSAGSIEGEVLPPVNPPGSSLNSVGLTMPSAFTVSNSPLTANGTIGVTGAGTVAQYIRGDGSLADFPESSGGGSSVSYYLNGSVNQGTIGGIAYKELSKVPILGAGTDFTINADGYIASFITDAGDPSLLEIPGGNWNFETYFSASSSGGTPTFYVELYKVSGTTATLIASSSSAPELIAFGTNLTPYFSTLAVPTTTLALTDRLAVRYYVTHSGRTITLHTENNHLCQIITTFTTGLTALNGLTAQVQNFAVGTTGTDFNIASATATHTFNLPTASATNRGALSSADWSLFTQAYNDKINSAAVTGTTTKTLTLTQQDGGTITASWSDLNTDAVLSVFGRTGAVVAANGDYTTAQVTESGNLYYTDARSRAALSFAAGSGAYNTSTGVITIPTNNNQITNGAGYITSAALAGYLPLIGGTMTGDINWGQTDRGLIWAFNTDGASIKFYNTGDGDTNSRLEFATLDNNNEYFRWVHVPSGGTIYESMRLVPNSSGNAQLIVSGSIIKSGGTSSQFLKADGSVDSTSYVSSVTASSPLASSGGTTPNITIQQASGSQSGFLSSTDWTTFNNKQNALTLTTTGTSGAATLVGATINIPQYQAALTNPVTGTGTTNTVPKFTGTSSIGDSQIIDNGTRVGIGVSPTTNKLEVGGGITIGTGTTLNTDIRINNATNGKIQYIFSDSSTGELGLESGTSVGIKFNTNGPNTKLIITSGGNVLIGNPPAADNGARLQVSGNATFSGAYGTSSGVYLSGTTYGVYGANRGATNASAGINYFSVGSQRWFSGVYENSDNFGFYSVGTSGFPLILNYSTGAATFSSSVTMAYGGNPRLTLQDTDAGSGNVGILFKEGTNDRWALASVGGAFQFFNETTSSNAIFITSGNNVGIGTPSPNANSRLHVYRGGGSYDTIIADGDAGTNTGFAIYEGGSARYALYSNGAGGNDSFNIYNFGAASNSLTILTNGNVGIGTPSPTFFSGNTTLAINNASGGAVLELQSNGTSALRMATSASDSALWEPRSVPVLFATANTERMRITNIGNILFKGQSTTTNAESIFQNINSALNFFASQSITVSKDIGFFSSTIQNEERLRLTATGNILMAPFSAGNVLIGTTTDTGNDRRLQVAGNLFVDDNSTTGNGVQLRNADRPLITRGWDAFTSGNKTGVGRWGVYMEAAELFLGSPGTDYSNGLVTIGGWLVNGTRQPNLTVNNQSRNVLIGTTTDNGQRLQVSGETRLSGRTGINTSPVSDAPLVINGENNSSANFGLLIRNSSSSNLFRVRNDGVVDTIGNPVASNLGSITINGTYQTIFTAATDAAYFLTVQTSQSDGTYAIFVLYNENSGERFTSGILVNNILVQFSGNSVQIRSANAVSYLTTWSAIRIK